jgi:hypothetical protein
MKSTGHNQCLNVQLFDFFHQTLLTRQILQRVIICASTFAYINPQPLTPQPLTASHRLSPPFANPYQSGPTTFTINITSTTASFVSAQLISMYLHKTLYLTEANVVCS